MSVIFLPCMGGQTGPVFYIYYEGMRHPPPILTRKKEFDLSKRKHGPTIVPALSANVDNKEKRFIQVGNSLLLSKQFHALSTGSRFLYFCMAMESGGRKEGFHSSAKGRKKVWNCAFQPAEAHQRTGSRSFYQSLFRKANTRAKPI